MSIKKNALLILFTIISVFAVQAQKSDKIDWWKHTSIYQVYPRSFMDSDGDGIGDINGIISKLNYIRDLGFDAIWFSPFFKSPQQDFGYDVGDYIAVDSVYGKPGDIEKLIEEVHNRGMKIIFDMVMNHTSVKHQWFQASIDSSSTKSDWYIWRDGKGKKAPNNWKNMLSQKGWNYEPKRKQWYWGSFLPFQPDLNWRNQAVKDSMFNTVRYWLNKGVDGFRLDIFNVLLEDSLFRDNPHGINYFPGDENPAGGFQRLKYNYNQPENYLLAKELRSVINEYDNRFLIGEVSGTHDKIKGFLGEKQDGLNCIFLFDFMHFKFSAEFFKDKMKTYETTYPAPNIPVYVYSNHDSRRSIGRVDRDLDKAKVLALVQLTARGVAVCYQGEEFGSSDARIKRKEALDPVAKLFPIPQFIVDRMGQIINRDECRTPMQWSAQANAGFSNPAAKTWLPINPEYQKINADRALSDSTSLIYVYQNLLHLRNDNSILKFGSSKIVENKLLPKSIYLLEREFEGKKLWIIANFSNNEVEFKNFINAANILYQIDSKAIIKSDRIKVPPFGGLIMN